MKRLENQSFVRREPDPGDGRYTHVILTDAGHAARVRQLFVDALDPDELQTLRRCADKIIARVDSSPEP